MHKSSNALCVKYGHEFETVLSGYDEFDGYFAEIRQQCKRCKMTEKEQ